MGGMRWETRHKHFRFAKFIARLLDDEFKIFGIGVGIDPLIGLIPGIGDMISLALSLYILWVGRILGLPDQILGKMIRNIYIDFVMGIVPILGDIGDIFFKANRRNLDMVEKHMQSSERIGEVEEGQTVRS